MPTHDYACTACKKTFTLIMSLAEYDKGKIICPNCKSKKTEQKPAAFFAVTAKKS